MTTAITAVLTLIGLKNFSRRDLLDPTSGLPIQIERNQTIRVSEEVADQLLDDEYSTSSGGEDGDDFIYNNWFRLEEDVSNTDKVTYDFTVPKTPPPVAAPAAPITTEHDLESLPEIKLLSDVVTTEGSLAKRTQRQPVKSRAK